MHRFWGIGELGIYLFKVLHIEDQSRLGRTCRYLFSLSLEFVWEKVNFSQMLKLLSEDGWKFYEGMGRPVLPADSWSFSRFHYYGRFVKILQYHLASHQIKALLLGPYADVIPHLPNVCSITIVFFVRPQHPELADLWRSLVTAETQEATITFLGAVNQPVPALYEALRTIPKSLQILDLQLRPDDARRIPAGQLQMVEAHPDLRSLALTASSLGLGVIPNLHQLTSLSLSLQGASDFSAIRYDTWPLLVELTLRGSLSDLTPLLARICSPHVSAITITPESGSGEMLQTMVDTLLKFSRLRALELNAEATRPSGWQPLFKRLIPCRGLREITIRVAPALIMSDSSILETIATTWPELEILCLSGFGPSSPAIPTLPHLQKLPGTLRKLEIALNIEADVSTPLEHTFPNMRRVKFRGRLPEPLIDHTAEAFKVLWPGLRQAEGPDAVTWRRLWPKVFGSADKQPWMTRDYYYDDPSLYG